MLKMNNVDTSTPSDGFHALMVMFVRLSVLLLRRVTFKLS